MDLQKCRLENVFCHFRVSEIATKIAEQLSFIPINQLSIKLAVAGFAVLKKEFFVGHGFLFGGKLPGVIKMQIVNCGLHTYIRILGKSVRFGGVFSRQRR